METFLGELGTVGHWLGSVLGALVGLVLLVAMAWLIATAVRRVLGVPVGWFRSVLVALLMVLSTNVVFDTVIRQVTGGDRGVLSESSVPAALVLVLIALLWIFGLGTALLMILEMVVPTGMLPNPVTWAAGLRSGWARNRRYRQVVGVFLRHGLGANLRGLGRRADDQGSWATTARALRRALEDSGITFVKLGQNLSARSDLLPEEVIRELSRLQSEVAPEPWGSIRGALSRSLGRDPLEVFDWVDEQPLAAASVAQVHRARLRDGTEVVLKVQRPGAVEEVTRDTDIVVRICRWLQHNTTWGKSLRILDLGRGFTRSLAEELDYHGEAANMRDMAAALSGHNIAVPAVYPEYSSRRLLVMDYLPGTPVGRAGPRLDALGPSVRRRLARELATSVMRQIMDDGIFHADLHPGNVMLLGEAQYTRLGLLDFGSVGRLDPRSQQQLVMVFASIERNDARLLSDALVELLGRPDQLDDRHLEREVGELLVRYRGGLRGGSASRLFGSLMRLILDHRFAVPKEVAAALRSLGGMEGTLKLIDPELEVVEAARELGAEMLRDRFSPGSLKDTATTALLDVLPIAAQLPRRVNRIADDLQAGRLSVNVRLLGDRDDRRYVTWLFQQVVVSILAGFCVLGGIVLLAFGEGGPAMTTYMTWHTAFGYIVLFAGFVLSLRTVALVMQRPGPEETPE
ncbi:AarF/ABC1/UbiB kinase family protein [Citricoccus sp. SGAir0253]|uniref:ABC1 kinase family protein n=1 Tax=Citricoccus sp. SGAir0253 TaxID=2567881 RepID=UPI0010CCF8D9|nr:AarF/UbiB family protein [Citricoccus sp. SGAir0253]QCU76834.1 AarF/ABC1/UbiB kinase family protein [Citricoccus sp. SGAir0253]